MPAASRPMISLRSPRCWPAACCRRRSRRAAGDRSRRPPLRDRDDRSVDPGAARRSPAAPAPDRAATTPDGAGPPLDRLRAGDGPRARPDRLQARWSRHASGSRRALGSSGPSTAVRRRPCRRAGRPGARWRRARRAACWASAAGSTGAASDATDAPDGAGPARPSTAPAAGRPSTRPASPTPRPPPRPTSTSPPPPASAARCSASCPTGSCSGASTKLNNDVLSTIAYFSVGADRDRQPAQEGHATARTRPAGAAGRARSMTSVISSAHQHGTRVVLTVSVFAWTTGQANVQRAAPRQRAPRALTLARQIAAAVRDRGADGVNLDFEPLASGYADEFVALAPDDPDASSTRSARATSSPTTRPASSATTRSRRRSAPGARRRDLHHGLRLPHLGLRRPPAPSTPCPAPPTTSPTRSAPTRPGSARRGSSSASRGTAGRGRPPAPSTRGTQSGDEVRLQHRGELRDRRRPRGEVRPPVGRRRGAARDVAYRRQNCTATYGCVTSWRQVYYDDAASLEAALRDGQRLRPARRRACGRSGYDGGQLRAVPRRPESFLVDKSAPQAGIRIARRRPQGDEGFVVSGRRATPAASSRTTSRSRSTAARGRRG